MLRQLKLFACTAILGASTVPSVAIASVRSGASLPAYSAIPLSAARARKGSRTVAGNSAVGAGILPFLIAGGLALSVLVVVTVTRNDSKG